MMTNAPRYIAYFRVSTDKQGRSGLGLEAQQESVRQFVRDKAGEIVASFQEIESGKNDDRPELAKAMKRCRMTGATLLVAKLDRLSRDAAFLLTLQKGTVKFVAANLPSADETTVGFMAIIAQHEARAIGQRTREALAAAKARGTKLGGFRAKAPDIGQYQSKGVKALRQKAKEDAEMVREEIETHLQDGLSLRAIAEKLEAAGTLTPRSRALYEAGQLTAENRAVWTARSVLNVINRLKITRQAA
jgi:DNA invertase Pin-like site-specific DNA recombinase